MRKLEVTLWSLAGLGSLLRVLHLPMANLVTVLSLSLLMLLYFWLSWLLFPFPTRKDQILGLSIFCGIAFTMTLEGLLFKVQLWPMAAFFNLLGLLLTGIAVALIIAMRGGRPGLKGYFSGLLRRAVPIFLLGLLLYPISEVDIMRFHHRNDPRAGGLIDRMEATSDPAERRALHQQLLAAPETDELEGASP